MRLEAVLYVNWIFWTAITSGTLLVVGLTERLGGTTRGYRLFMAWLLLAFAAILALSELALPTGVVADATATIRRPLALAVGGGAVVYLLASAGGWPRSGIAIGAGLVGLGALGALAAAGGSDNAALFTGQLILTALALGAVNAGMLLGHWYLVTPKLSPVPLRRVMWLLAGALVLQGLLFGVAVAGGPEALEGGLGMLTWLRLGVGIVLPIVATILAILASSAASLQASTGLLYIGLALVMAGSIAGASITYLTGVPV